MRVSPFALSSGLILPYPSSSGEYSVPEDFLKKFSRYNFDGFCLGVLFTNRAFSELVLGKK